MGGTRRGPLTELWSVPFERVRPVRTFPSFRGQKSFPGLYYAATMDAHVGFESWAERDHYRDPHRQVLAPPARAARTELNGLHTQVHQRTHVNQSYCRPSISVVPSKLTRSWSDAVSANLTHLLVVSPDLTQQVFVSLQIAWLPRVANVRVHYARHPCGRVGWSTVIRQRYRWPAWTPPGRF